MFYLHLEGTCEHGRYNILCSTRQIMFQRWFIGNISEETQDKSDLFGTGSCLGNHNFNLAPISEEISLEVKFGSSAAASCATFLRIYYVLA